MVADLIRKVLPKSLTKLLGGIVWRSAQRMPLLGILYGYFIFSILLRRTREGDFFAEYKGMNVLFPRSELGVFFRVFCDDIYERAFRVQEGDVVIDIGASIGFFCLKAAHETGREGRVVAIEPEPRNLALLRENGHRNGFNNVVIIGKACGSHKAKVPLYVKPGCGAHSLLPISSHRIEVEMDTLDNLAPELALDHVDFIKIDTEGSELEILKGAEKTLHSSDVKLAIGAYHTLHNGSFEFPEIFSWLTLRGFEIETKNNEYIYAFKRSGDREK